MEIQIELNQQIVDICLIVLYIIGWIYTFRWCFKKLYSPSTRYDECDVVMWFLESIVAGTFWPIIWIFKWIFWVLTWGIIK